MKIILSKVLTLEKEVCRLENQKLIKSKEFQLKKDILKDQAQKLNEKNYDTNINIELEELEKLHDEMLNLKNQENEILNNLKININEKRKELMFEMENLKQLKMNLNNEYYILIEKLELLNAESNDDKIQEINQTIKEINNIFHLQMNDINDLEKRLLCLINYRNSDISALLYEEDSKSLVDSVPSKLIAIEKCKQIYYAIERYRGISKNNRAEKKIQDVVFKKFIFLRMMETLLHSILP